MTNKIMFYYRRPKSHEKMLQIGLSRPRTQTYIIEICTWNATTFVSNARTIFKQQGLRAINAYLLQLSSSRIGSFFADNGTKIGLNVIGLYP